jgi:probable F420-dependent oxidoreductase
MKFGTSLPLVQLMPGTPDWQRAAGIDGLMAVARRADELGYEWLPCSDHVLVPRPAEPSMGTTWFEPATTLSFVAAITKRIRLLSHVVVLPYHSPFDVAKQYATLDALSGGRVILGVGTGHLRAEFRALGAQFEGRGAVTDDRIRTIESLWRGEADLSMEPRPLQRPHPPIWVGGNTRRAARRAVELGDGWVPWQVTLEDVHDRLDYARRLPSFERRMRPLDVALPVGPVQITGRPLDGERAAFTGTVQQVIEDIRAYQEAGVTGMTVNFNAGSLDEHLERIEQFARDVMPAFG